MWWKIASVFLITWSIIAGLKVPLKPGVIRISPETSLTGKDISLKIFGYNTFYSKSEPKDIRVWLIDKDDLALSAHNIKVLSDTVLQADFSIPANLAKNEAAGFLTVLINHPTDGHSLLPDGLSVTRDSALGILANDSLWQIAKVENLHLRNDFTFPYQNIIYESIRNTYYHVPMWFGLMAMFIASVVFSVHYLKNPTLENDRKAATYASIGLLFGFLGLFTGMVWAHYAWGAAWSNDIKQIMTAVCLLVYVAYFILRSSFDEPEKGARLAAVYNIFAFASLIPLLYIVPRLFASLHPGATGNPAFGSQDLDNTMRMVFYPAIIGWILMGFWIAEIKIRIGRLEDRALGID